MVSLYDIFFVHLLGKDPLIVKLDRLKSMIVSRPYDYLDHRNSLFEADYDEFKERISEIHVR